MTSSDFRWTTEIMRIFVRQRFRLLVFMILFGLICLYLFTTEHLHIKNLRPSEECPNFMSRQEKFANCSGCFASAHIPVLINQPQICATSTNQTVDIIILVYTRVEGEDTRNLIRQTWASVSKNNTSNFRHVFMLGTSPDTGHMLAVKKESDIHRDVVVTDFQDSYLNLTLKTVTSLHWITRHCSHARFFLKIDDDIWLNTKGLLLAFNKHADALQKGLGGYLRVNTNVIRQPRSLWYASCEAYPDRVYPSYPAGGGYGGSLRVARLLSARCKDIPFFHLEDVFLGLCQERLGLTVVNVKEMQMRRPVQNVCEAKNDNIALVYPASAKRRRQFWLAKPCGKDSRGK